jgi:tetratricopeptide (TPR) repeat protein
MVVGTILAVMAAIAGLTLPDFELARIRVAAQREDWDDCLQRAENVLAGRPGDSDALGWAARAALELGRVELADRYLGQVPNPPVRDLERLGNALLAQKRWLRAVTVFERVAAVEPHNVHAAQKLAGIYFHLGQWDHTRRHARTLVDHPEYAAVAYCLIGAIDGARGDTTKAVENLRRAIELAPIAKALPLPLYEIHSLLGRNLINLARPAEAEAQLRIAAELNRTDDVCHLLALARFEQGDLDGAESWSLQALHLNPRHAAAFETLAMLAEQRGRFVEAIGWYKLAIRYTVRPASGLHYALAQVYGRAGLADRAKEELATNKRLQAEEYRQGVEERVLEEHPESPTAQFLLAQRAAREGNVREAEERLDKLFKLFPDDPQVKKLKRALNERDLGPP